MRSGFVWVWVLKAGHIQWAPLFAANACALKTSSWEAIPRAATRKQGNGKHARSLAFDVAQRDKRVERFAGQVAGFWTDQRPVWFRRERGPGIIVKGPASGAFSTKGRAGTPPLWRCGRHCAPKVPCCVIYSLQQRDLPPLSWTAGGPGSHVRG
jgi:hypothetical protein